MKAAKQILKVSATLANLGLVGAVMLRNPDLRQYLATVAGAMFFTAITCGVTILCSGYYKTAVQGAKRQHDAHRAFGSSGDKTSPVSTT
ncbi:hypothetical protein [Lacipirellula parvula]|uniref:Uncharacterized protein n=1 Tax=Lacipirellula parvula TaxID=2650471 RepID=A0A5K7XHJ5_9BACT|nr:hypothetical protein [Lacipirellula parvula]BBO32429.1 hypothetical protein PLANPX_2041 [Lacipirellula parvula]